MKKELLMFVFLVLVAGCVKKPDFETPGGNEKLAANVERLTTTEEFDVPVKGGNVTRVTMDGVLLAEIVTPTTILIPRTSSLTRGESGVQHEFVPIDDYPNGIVLENSSKLYQVVCFEDSRESDYDYNDLVFHVKYQTKGKLFGFGIQPVALGSKKPINLGYVLYRGNKQVDKGFINNLGKNCRAQLFQDKEGYLNTPLWEAQPNFFPRNPEVGGWREYLGSTIRCWDMTRFEGNGIPRVEWFIQVDMDENGQGGEEFYALSTTYLRESFTKDGVPRGLVITNTGVEYTDKGNVACGYDWFNYPAENTHIKTVYPQLWNWLTTDAAYDFSDFYSKDAPTGAYPAAALNLFSVTDADVCRSVTN